MSLFISDSFGFGLISKAWARCENRARYSLVRADGDVELARDFTFAGHGSFSLRGTQSSLLENAMIFSTKRRGWRTLGRGVWPLVRRGASRDDGVVEVAQRSSLRFLSRKAPRVVARRSEARP